MWFTQTARSNSRPHHRSPRSSRVHARSVMGALFASTLVVLAPAAQAQFTSLGTAKVFSLGLSAMGTDWRADCLSATACDRRDSGWRLTGAWQFAPQGALELVGAEQGRVRAESLSAGVLNTSELRIRGAGVNVAWLMPLETDWLLTARVGAVANRARFVENAGLGVANEIFTRTHTDPTLGLGLSWRLSTSLSLDGRYDWTYTRLAPPAQSLIGGGSTGSHQWGLGLTGYF